MRLLLLNMAVDADDAMLGFAVRWITALASRVDFVHVITMRVGRQELPSNVMVHSLGKEKGYGDPHRAWEFYRHLGRIMRDGPVDACFSHMTPLFTVLAAPVLRVRSIPIVTWYAHRQLNNTLKLAHHLSTRMVSSADLSYPYRRDKLVLLGQGIDTELFSPGTNTYEGNLVLSVGRLSPIKDPLTLVRATHLLRRRGHDVRCVFVGQAPARDRAYAARVREEVERLRLGDVVTLVGGVHHDDVTGWYRRCCVHVNCFPTGSLDKAVLEAMACGKPSLTSNQAFGEVMGQYADRLVFRSGDASDLAGKIEQLLSMPHEARSAMCSGLREIVVDHHSLEGLADRLVDVLMDAKSRP